MNIIRRNSESPVSAYRPMSMDDHFGRLFENMVEDFFAPLMSYPSLSKAGEDSVTYPRLNVTESDQTFEVEVELPGLTKEDIKVAIDNRRVSIEGEATQNTEQKEGQNVVYAERSSRRFARSFTLPTAVDDAGAQAKLENGILKLVLPKKEAAQVKKLAVQ
jgi:HSP20 family protein